MVRDGGRCRFPIQTREPVVGGCPRLCVLLVWLSTLPWCPAGACWSLAPAPRQMTVQPNALVTERSVRVLVVVWFLQMDVTRELADVTSVSNLGAVRLQRGVVDAILVGQHLFDALHHCHHVTLTGLRRVRHEHMR